MKIKIWTDHKRTYNYCTKYFYKTAIKYYGDRANLWDHVQGI
jgi:hypothetical protein